MEANSNKEHSHYKGLLWMGLLSFISMYILMYAMVDGFKNVFPNHNQAYMAVVMTAPMIVIELLLMKMMYPDNKKNIIVIGLSIVLLAVFFLFIRKQSGIGDKQFLKSMIPHHGGALLMCREASLTDPDIKQLCQEILISQQSEIDRMKEILKKY